MLTLSLALPVAAEPGHRPATAAMTRPPATVLLYAPGVAGTVARSFWGPLLEQVGRPWRATASLRGVQAKDAPLLLVSVEGRALSPQAMRRLSSLQRQGVVLIVSGRPAGPTGGSDLRRLLGVPMRKRPGGDLHVASVGQTPLTSGMPAGTRIVSQTGPFWVPQRAGAWRTAAEFTDWSYRPPHDEAVPAILYGQHHGHRWVYLAAEPHDVEPPEIMSLTALLRSSLTWLDAAAPIAAHLADWPAGFRSAQLVEMDTELDDRKDVRVLDAALQLGQWMAEAGAQASFYCVTGDLALRPEVLATLAAQGHDLGLHGDRHDPFGGTPPDAQRERIRDMWAQWRALRGDAGLTGFRAPYESYDASTEQALATVGVAYHVSDAASAVHRLPFDVEAGEGRHLLRLPRSQPDDYRFEEEHLDAAAVKRLLRIDAQAAHRLGALGLLSMHPQYFAEGAPVRTVFRDWLAGLDRGPGGIWLASGGRIAQWWRERSSMSLQAQAGGFRITVAEPSPLDSVTVIVDADVRERDVLSTDTTLMTIRAVRAWPDERGPTWQTAIDLQLRGAGTAEVTWTQTPTSRPAGPARAADRPAGGARGSAFSARR